MRNTRIHIDEPLRPDAELTLPAAAAHHLVRVLRLRPGDRFMLFNGDGLEYPGELTEASTRGTCRVRLGQPLARSVESPLNITLVQAISRGERMDWTIQKSTELGVSRIQPVFTERCEVRLTGQRAGKRLRHWQQVAIAAAEQSGRVQVPKIHAPIALDEIGSASGTGLFLDPAGDVRPGDLGSLEPADLVVVIGPEGGLSAAETRQLRQAGYRGLRLGPRILRTETAGPAALVVLQTVFGDW